MPPCKPIPYACPLAVEGRPHFRRRLRLGLPDDTALKRIPKAVEIGPGRALMLPLPSSPRR